jgi:cellulose biosynthesis protein BcsQ
MLSSSRNGPELKIRSWWSTPRSLSTPKKLLEEFNWAVNGLLSDIPGGITDEDAERFADEMRIVCGGMKSHTDRLPRLKESYDRLIVDARARLAVFDGISQGASDL